MANPTSFLAQKILIHHERDYKDRAKDLLYTHDTIELFSEHLDELQKISVEITPQSECRTPRSPGRNQSSRITGDLH